MPYEYIGGGSSMLAVSDIVYAVGGAAGVFGVTILEPAGVKINWPFVLDKSR